MVNLVKERGYVCGWGEKKLYIPVHISLYIMFILLYKFILYIII